MIVSGNYPPGDITIAIGEAIGRRFGVHNKTDE